MDALNFLIFGVSFSWWVVIILLLYGTGLPKIIVLLIFISWNIKRVYHIMTGSLKEQGFHNKRTGFPQHCASKYKYMKKAENDYKLK